MTRLLPSALSLFTLVLALFVSQGSSAQENPKPEARPGAWGQADFLFVPGFWQLSQEAVRSEIEIVPEQLEKLKKISKEYMEEQKTIYAPIQQPAAGEQPRSQEELQKLYGEMQKKMASMSEKYTVQVKEVLLPHQVKALEDIDFRNKASTMLQYPYYVDRLNLTDKQKEEVKKNRDILAKKIQKAQQEALDEVMGLLTPEQIETLKAPWPGQQAQVKK